MKTKAFLPIGTEKSNETKLVQRGDVLKLITGEEITFVEMRRTKFVGIFNGKNIIVPIYRDRLGLKPYVLSKLNKVDKSVIVKSANVDKFKKGDLFSLEGYKETFMYIGKSSKGKNKISALDLSTGKTFTISEGFTFKKIDINKIKKELING